MTINEIVIAKLKRQLLIERVATSIAALALVVYWIVSNFACAKTLIVVNGKPVVCVKNAAEAQNVLAEIKSSAGGASSEVQFKEDVEMARAPRTSNPVDRHMALRTLRGEISPVIKRWAVIADGQPVVAVDSNDTAGAVLDMAKLRFGKLAKNLAEEPQFKQKVTVAIAPVDPEMCKPTPEAAVDFLFKPANETTTDAVYTVRKGDVASSIAYRHSLKLPELWTMNPGRNLNKLGIGDKIRVKKHTAGPEKLTVVVRDQVERDETMPAPVQQVSTATLFTGKMTQISPGRPGRRHVKAVSIYENGRKVGYEIIDEQILKEPVPRRIAVGIKPRPQW